MNAMYLQHSVAEGVLLHVGHIGEHLAVLELHDLRGRDGER